MESVLHGSVLHGSVLHVSVLHFKTINVRRAVRRASGRVLIKTVNLALRRHREDIGMKLNLILGHL